MCQRVLWGWCALLQPNKGAGLWTVRAYIRTAVSAAGAFGITPTTGGCLSAAPTLTAGAVVGAGCSKVGAAVSGLSAACVAPTSIGGLLSAPAVAGTSRVVTAILRGNAQGRLATVGAGTIATAEAGHLTKILAAVPARGAIGVEIASLIAVAAIALADVAGAPNARRVSLTVSQKSGTLIAIRAVARAIAIG